MARPDTPEKDETRGLLENFLNSNFESKDQTVILDAVKSLLKAKSQYSEPKRILPVDEVDLRRDYALQIENRLATDLPEFELTSVHLAAIMITPLINLERGGYLSPQNLSVDELAARLGLVTNLVKRHLGRKFEKETGPATNQKRPQSHTASSRKSRSTKQSENPDDEFNPGLTQKELCRARDQYRCLFMKTAEGDVAHIIPHSWNKDQGNVDKTKLVIPAAQVFMDHQLFSKYQKTFANRRNFLSTDKIWNMLYLNKQQHWYFDHGSIAFKCLGIEPHNDTNDKADVLIQIHWLHRTKINPNKVVTCLGDANDLDKMIDGLRQFEDQGFPARIEPDKGLYAAVRANNYVPIISGHYVRVTMSCEDAEKCQAMLQLSWALSVVAAMSGSAEAPDLLPDHDDWEGIEQQASVDNWVQDQVQRHEQLREVDLLSGAADLGTATTLRPGVPALPPRSPERVAHSPARSSPHPLARSPVRSPVRSPAPLPRTPPRALGASQTPLGTITNRPRRDSSPEKRKLRLELLDSRTGTSPRRGDATRGEATRDPSPDKASEKPQEGQEPASPRQFVLQTEPRQGSPRSPRSPRK